MIRCRRLRVPYVWIGAGVFVFSLLITIGGTPKAWALSLFGNSQTPPRKVLMTETTAYRVLIQPSGRVRETALEGGKKTEWEVGYKFVCLADKDWIFGTSRKLEVVFFDRKGFVLARDTVSYEQLDDGAAYYGFVWMTGSRVKDLKEAVVRPYEKTPETPPVMEKDAPSGKSVTEPEVLPATLPMENEKKVPVKMRLDIGGIKNEEVQERISDWEKQKQTEVDKVTRDAPPEEEVKGNTSE